jgi:hypothetical protein
VSFGQKHLVMFGKNEACIEASLRPKNLNIVVKTKSILFLDIMFFIFVCEAFLLILDLFL